MITSSLIAASVVYGVMFVILLGCFVYAILNRNWIVATDQEDDAIAEKVLSDSDRFSLKDEDLAVDVGTKKINPEKKTVARVLVSKRRRQTTTKVAGDKG